MSYEFRPMVSFKLMNRQFELSVLRAIFDHESNCKSLMGLPGHPSTWGWAARSTLARRMGHGPMSKSVSRKIRRAFLWLEDRGYLKHVDVNQVGDKHGATRFLVAFWVFRVVAQAREVVSKAFEAFSRTPGEKPTTSRVLRQLLRSSVGLDAVPEVRNG